MNHTPIDAKEVPLPEPFHKEATTFGWPDLFTAEQMLAYGKACASSEPVAQPVIDKSMLKRLVTQVFGEGYSIVLSSERDAPPPANAMARIGEILGMDQDADPSDIIEEIEGLDGYLKRLTTSVWERHFRNHCPEFELMHKTAFVLTQLDNMTCGLSRPTAAPELQNHSVAATSTLSSNPNGLLVAGWKLMPPNLSAEMKEILKEAAPRWNAESIYASLLSYAAPLVAAEVPQIQEKQGYVMVPPTVNGASIYNNLVAASVSLHGEANGLSEVRHFTMDCAPKDGTHILCRVFVDRKLVEVEAYWYQLGKPPNVCEGWITDLIDCGNYEFNPVDWRPMSANKADIALLREAADFAQFSDHPKPIKAALFRVIGIADSASPSAPIQGKDSAAQDAFNPSLAQGKNTEVSDVLKGGEQ
jgi:hypothetical protein